MYFYFDSELSEQSSGVLISDNYSEGHGGGIFISTDGKYGYFASDRFEGYGGLDIYRFELDEKLKPGAVSYVKGKVTDVHTKQPFGLMHGGAAVLLLETLASAAANHCVDPQTQICVGLEINCNHLRAVREGVVTGRATAAHVGKSSMVWLLEIHDDKARLVTTGRLTSAVTSRL